MGGEHVRCSPNQGLPLDVPRGSPLVDGHTGWGNREGSGEWGHGLNGWIHELLQSTKQRVLSSMPPPQIVAGEPRSVPVK